MQPGRAPTQGSARTCEAARDKNASGKACVSLSFLQDRQSSLPASLLVAFTVRLLKVDRLLAEISVDEAAAGGASPKKIEQEQVARGDADASEGRAESAIEHYRNAWKHAIRLRKD